MYRNIIYSIVVALMFSCSSNNERELAKKENELIVKENALLIKENELLKKERTTTKSDSSVEKPEKIDFNWVGSYDNSKGTNPDAIYSLTVNRESPARWAEFGFELEAMGRQLFFKIAGYAIINDGFLDFYYTETLDGGFSPFDKVDINSPIFSLSYEDGILKTHNRQIEIDKMTKK
jgi:hypothetical protein